MSLLRFVRRRKIEERYGGIEKRKYYRIPFEHSLRFQSINPENPSQTQIGKSQNISQGGMLFKAVNPIPRKSFVLMESDNKALSKVIKIDNQLATVDGKIMGRVVRTHLNLHNGLFEIAVEFIPTNAKEKKIVRDSIREIGQKLDTRHHRLDKRRFGFF